MNNKLSVIIPVYNVEEYLEKCIESVLKQAYSPFEVILVDDGSSDKSSSICDQYGSKMVFGHLMEIILYLLTVTTGLKMKCLL